MIGKCIFTQPYQSGGVQNTLLATQCHGNLGVVYTKSSYKFIDPVSSSPPPKYGDV